MNPQGTVPMIPGGQMIQASLYQPQVPVNQLESKQSTPQTSASAVPIGMGAPGSKMESMSGYSGPVFQNPAMYTNTAFAQPTKGMSTTTPYSINPKEPLGFQSFQQSMAPQSQAIASPGALMQQQQQVQQQQQQQVQQPAVVMGANKVDVLPPGQRQQQPPQPMLPSMGMQAQLANAAMVQDQQAATDEFMEKGMEEISKLISECEISQKPAVGVMEILEKTIALMDTKEWLFVNNDALARIANDNVSVGKAFKGKIVSGNGFNMQKVTFLRTSALFPGYFAKVPVDVWGANHGIRVFQHGQGSNSNAVEFTAEKI